MLSGVYFRSLPQGASQPEFVNQFAFTDVYLASVANPALKESIAPSIATFLNPSKTAIGFIRKIWHMLRVITHSQMGGYPDPIERISVANTSIIHHDGRTLTMCESGPPLRVSLPELRTVGWFNGLYAMGEPVTGPLGQGLGGTGLFKLFREMTTGHPRVDPKTQELVLFHSIYIPPYVTYSVIPRRNKSPKRSTKMQLNSPVPGISSPKLMHDFGVSHNYTVIIDLPLKLSLANLLRDKCVLEYDPCLKTRFGVFPRHNLERIRWFEADACCIFHTVNTWESEKTGSKLGSGIYVNMLVCRMNHPAFVFTTADLDPQPPITNEQRNNLQSRLYLYQFDISQPWNTISQQWALSAIPFEFPHVPKRLGMSATRYVYGASTTEGSFGIALGKSLKIDCLVKFDVERLIQAGVQCPPERESGCVDSRGIHDVLAEGRPNDTIQIFRMPTGWYAQECSFVPRDAAIGEDDGYLLTYVFDESQLDSEGDAMENACSELWIIDAKGMQEVVARVILPQRVPYGIHGNWFPQHEVDDQRPVEAYRELSKYGC
ncbi:unnamed protein product [Penicillium olsonii]|nr:unnamed protein product [Penicillium olsonii]